jgi:hypothetical protein
MLGILAAEFERELIRKRRIAGLASARRVDCRYIRIPALEATTALHWPYQQGGVKAAPYGVGGQRTAWAHCCRGRANELAPRMNRARRKFRFNGSESVSHCYRPLSEELHHPIRQFHERALGLAIFGFRPSFLFKRPDERSRKGHNRYQVAALQELQTSAGFYFNQGAAL